MPSGRSNRSQIGALAQAQEIQAQARARARTQEQEDLQAQGHDHAQDHAQAEAQPPQAPQQEDQEQAQSLQALVIQPTRIVEKPFDVKFANPLEQPYEDNNDFSFMPFRARDSDEWNQEHMTKACLFQISHYVYQPAGNFYDEKKNTTLQCMVYLIDAFGSKGNNMVVIMAHKNSDITKLYSDCQKFRDNGKTSKYISLNTVMRK